MTRSPWTLSAVGVMLAGLAGCAMLRPDAPVADPRVAGSLPVTDAAAAPTVGVLPHPELPPQGLMSPSAVARESGSPASPAAQVAAAREPATAAAGAPSAAQGGSARRATDTRRAPTSAKSTPAAPSRAQPTRAHSAGALPAADTAGPTVTTFVYSDAPTRVVRGTPRDEAPAPAGRVPEGFNPYRIAFAPGAYRCELGRSVQVRSVSADLRTTVLGWGRDDYTLRSVEARSGALRYEDPASGLAWIVLKDRSMLLDTRAGQRLANACRSAA
jgi:hypothetical protein